MAAHNDHFLAEAFRDTLHWGAYMTDLLTEVNSKSNTLDLNATTIHRDVAVLVDQFQALGAADPLTSRECQAHKVCFPYEYLATR